jgi:hypothetical protein
LTAIRHGRRRGGEHLVSVARLLVVVVVMRVVVADAVDRCAEQLVAEYCSVHAHVFAILDVRCRGVGLHVTVDASRVHVAVHGCRVCCRRADRGSRSRSSCCRRVGSWCYAGQGGCSGQSHATDRCGHIRGRCRLNIGCLVSGLDMNGLNRRVLTMGKRRGSQRHYDVVYSTSATG